MLFSAAVDLNIGPWLLILFDNMVHNGYNGLKVKNEVMKMNRITSVLLALLLLVFLSACELPQVSEDAAGEQAEWERFIEEYNEFADEYVQLFEQYKENPQDMSIFEDFTDAASKAAEWASKATEMTKELIGAPEDAAKFAAELLEIAKKLAGITS